jgi:hypothetical protein
VKKSKVGGIYATGHDWKWDHADPHRNTATCPRCGVLTKLEGEARVYFRDGAKLDAFPSCVISSRA